MPEKDGCKNIHNENITVHLIYYGSWQKSKMGIYCRIYLALTMHVSSRDWPCSTNDCAGNATAMLGATVDLPVSTINRIVSKKESTWQVLAVRVSTQRE